jgi:uncharacterized membrane protein YfcA
VPEQPSGWLLLLFCGWLAATLSGAAGFGGALLLLPLLTQAVGAKAAVPILTVAQFLGNLSRAGFGWKGIQWRPVLLFSAGALPACMVGACLFAGLPSIAVLRGIAVALVLVVALRHTSLGKRPIAEKALPSAGAAVGLLSAIAGSAGPVGATVFLSLNLPAVAYVSSEAATATLMHVAKTVIYGRYALISPPALVFGLSLGAAMALGSWTGRRLIERVPEEKFSHFVEALLVVSAIALFLR